MIRILTLLIFESCVLNLNFEMRFLKLAENIATYRISLHSGMIRIGWIWQSVKSLWKKFIDMDAVEETTRVDDRLDSYRTVCWSEPVLRSALQPSPPTRCSAIAERDDEKWRRHCMLYQNGQGTRTAKMNFCNAVQMRINFPAKFISR